VGSKVSGQKSTASPTTALVETLQMLARRLVALTAAAVDQFSRDPITLPQYRTLVVVAGHPGATAGEVAAELGVSAPAVTRLVRTLTRRTLITRRTDEHDRRQVRLRLTPRGTDLVASVTRAREQQFRRAVQRFSDADRDTLLSSLEQLLDGLDVPTR
jgi:DNA-binding MarR family transcriptional regulator